MIKNQRITNGLRATVLHNMAEALFMPKKKALEGQLKALGDQIYDGIIEDYREHLSQLPAMWFTSGTQFGVAWDGGAYSRHVVNMSKARRLWPEARYSNNGITITKPEVIKLVERHAKLLKELIDLENEMGALRSRVDTMLQQFSGTKKLAEHWPEVVEYLPKEDEPENKALVITAEGLNAAIAEIKARVA